MARSEFKSLTNTALDLIDTWYFLILYANLNPLVDTPNFKGFALIRIGRQIIRRTDGNSAIAQIHYAPALVNE